MQAAIPMIQNFMAGSFVQEVVPVLAILFVVGALVAAVAKVALRIGGVFFGIMFCTYLIDGPEIPELCLDILARAAETFRQLF